MLKRNPDVIALVVLSFFMFVPSMVKWRTALHRPGVVITQQRTRPRFGAGLHQVGTQLRGTVASLKQCLHPSSRHNRPIVRPL